MTSDKNILTTIGEKGDQSSGRPGRGGWSLLPLLLHHRSVFGVWLLLLLCNTGYAGGAPDAPDLGIEAETGLKINDKNNRFSGTSDVIPGCCVEIHFFEKMIKFNLNIT